MLKSKMNQAKIRKAIKLDDARDDSKMKELIDEHLTAYHGGDRKVEIARVIETDRLSIQKDRAVDGIFQDIRESNKPKKSVWMAKNLKRDEILKDYYIKEHKGTEWHANAIKSFKGLDHYALIKLHEQGYINMQGKQNKGPTVKEINDLMAQYPFLKAEGYAVSFGREDARVTIDGLNINHTEMNLYPEAVKSNFYAEWDRLEESADESSHKRLWWD